MKTDDTPNLEPYIKKVVDLSLDKATLHFAAAQALFSSHRIDVGTSHLLRSLEGLELKAGSKILDLGCGYGPLGLTLKHNHPGSKVHLVDRDALAVAFARHNAALNEISPIEAYGSLGYDDVKERSFDLIVSNIPGKAGYAAITAMVHDARHYLAKDGIAAIVVVAPLAPVVEKALTSPDVEMLVRKESAAHIVYHYQFTESSPPETATGLERGLYDREAMTFVLDTLTLPMQTARGLPEFDALSYETALIYKILRDIPLPSQAKALVFNPGQGHLPTLLYRLLNPDSIDLVDRDLLSLRYSTLNLINQGFPRTNITTAHQVALAPSHTARERRLTLIVGRLREDEGPDAIEQSLIEAVAHLTPAGHLLIAGGSTPITRVLKSKPLDERLRVVKRKRKKGSSAALLVRR